MRLHALDYLYARSDGLNAPGVTDFHETKLPPVLLPWKIAVSKMLLSIAYAKNVIRGLSVIFPMIEKKDNGRTKFSGHKGNKNAKNVIRANGPRRSMCPST